MCRAKTLFGAFVLHQSAKHLRSIAACSMFLLNRSNYRIILAPPTRLHATIDPRADAPGGAEIVQRSRRRAWS